MVVNGSLAGPEIHFELRYYFAINELFITNFYCTWNISNINIFTPPPPARSPPAQDPTFDLGQLRNNIYCV